MPDEISLRSMQQYIQQLEAQLKMKTEQVEELNKYVSDASSAVQQTINQCRKFCTSILEGELASGKISAKEIESLSLTDLLARAKSVHNTNQQKSREIYIKFSEKIEEKNRMIEGLQAQVSQLMIQLSNSDPEKIPEVSDVENLTTAPVFPLGTSFGNKSGNAPSARQALTAAKILGDGDESVVSFSDKVATETNLNASGVLNNDAFKKNYHMIDLDKFMKDITPPMWLVIQTIGEQGINEQAEIKAHILQNLVGQDSSVNDSTINIAISNLMKMQILKRIKIVCGNRWFYIFELDEMGIRAYIGKFSKKPVVSEAQKLIREHDNIKHGYLIKEAASILKSKYNYESISTSRKVNYIRLPNGKACIPDITCARKGSMVDYYEVECGNHNQEDFNDKCNKYRMVTKTIRFIVPQNEVLKVLQSQISNWIKSCGGHEVLQKGEMVVKVTTMKKLLENKWELVYDMSSDEPTVAQNSAE